MKYIEKIKLHNFKRFPALEVKLNESRNIFVGENEAGKSSILTAISLVLTASRIQIEKIGLERLMNVSAVQEFLASDRSYENLPILYIELYLNDHNDYRLDGRNNSDKANCHGLRMECRPDDDFSDEIKDILQSDAPNFPFDYYRVHFNTFQGDPYTGYKRFIKYLLIDTSTVSTDYATRDYIGRMYDAYAEPAERNKHQYEYRRLKAEYRENVLGNLNDRVDDCQFALKSDSKSNLNTDLTLIEDNIEIENKGKGKQCFIKTSFALKRAENPDRAIDIALIEEPENHLSHINMKKLIARIDETEDKQLIIATHSNMISARLDLRYSILLHSGSLGPVLFTDLPEDTADFFVKAPDHGVLDFILARKVLLVEGDAEYILMEKMFETVTGQTLDEANVHVLSVGGISFKRYLDIAKLLDMQVSVLRDNDGDYQENCVDGFVNYVNDSIKVFGDEDNARYTFEVCIYQDNQEKCDALFGERRRALTVQDYMLSNKAEVAYKILCDEDELAVPAYIREGIEWLAG